MSQLRHVELADECESIKTNTNYVLAGFMTHWRAGSRACSRLNFCEFFFSLKKLSQLRGAEPATRRWASYVALSQLRGTEPATWHWASKVALSFELARRQWASKVALSFIIYIYIYLCNPNHIICILNLGQNIFFWGRHVPLSWSGNVKSTIRQTWQWEIPSFSMMFPFITLHLVRFPIAHGKPTRGWNPHKNGDDLNWGCFLGFVTLLPSPGYWNTPKNLCLIDLYSREFHGFPT